MRESAQFFIMRIRAWEYQGLADSNKLKYRIEIQTHQEQPATTGCLFLNLFSFVRSLPAQVWSLYSLTVRRHFTERISSKQSLEHTVPAELTNQLLQKPTVSHPPHFVHLIFMHILLKEAFLPPDGAFLWKIRASVWKFRASVRIFRASNFSSGTSSWMKRAFK